MAIFRAYQFFPSDFLSFFYFFFLSTKNGSLLIKNYLYMSFIFVKTLQDDILASVNSRFKLRKRSEFC